jgi:metal-sulfur cluster biosynthetic enzyme
MQPVDPSTTDIRERVLTELDQIQDPCSIAAAFPMGLSEMGLIADVSVSLEGHVHVRMRLTGPGCHMVGYFNEEIENRISALPGIRSVVMTFDVGLEWTPEHIRAETARRRKEALAARYGF